MVDAHAGHVEIVVVVELEPGVQQHHRNVAADRADDVRRELAVFRGIRERRAEVEANRDVVAREVLQRRAAVDSFERLVFRVLLENADTGFLEPEKAKQPVHRTRVEQLDALEAELRPHALGNVAIHLLDAVLLLMTGLVPAQLVRLPVFIEREQVEHVDVLAGDVPIPVPRAAARDHDQAPLLEAELPSAPS